MNVIALLQQDPDVVPELASASVALVTRVTLSVVRNGDGVRESREGGLEVRESGNGARARGGVCGVRGGLNSHPLVFCNDVDIDFPGCARELVPTEACGCAR